MDAEAFEDFVGVGQQLEPALADLAARSAGLLDRAAGGLPGETAKGWRVKAPNSFDLEFGFSCMGYEIAAGWGCAMGQSGPGGLGGTPIVMLGDGTYMMMNSDIYSTVLTGHKMIVIVCDNGGYAVINRLQNFKGVPSFNNQIADCKVIKPFSVDFAKHAESMGALTRKVESLAELGLALDWAKTTDRTTVITIVSDAFTWTPGETQGGADYSIRVRVTDNGAPALSDFEAVSEILQFTPAATMLVSAALTLPLAVVTAPAAVPGLDTIAGGSLSAVRLDGDRVLDRERRARAAGRG